MICYHHKYTQNLKISMINFCNRLITYSFYALFIGVPLFFTSNTSELFELNKMWLAWGLTIIITCAWIGKMILERKIVVKRTPLDIPILLFLISQLIATILSLDSRVSVWGYYSRFNGGFLSILTYTLLYYILVSTSTIAQAKKYLYITIITAVVVALWGFPSHFGFDPTCLMFRGTLDTACWTESFRPTIRIFSTLGQPAWMAAYLAALLPITMAGFIWEREKQNLDSIVASVKKPKVIGLLLLTTLFYLDLLYTDTRGGFIAFWAANILFWPTLFLFKQLPTKKLLGYFITFSLIFLLCNFLVGIPIPQLDKFSLRSIKSQQLVQQAALKPTPAPAAAPVSTSSLMDSGITDSGTIRLLVWRGAIDIWKAHPVFGSGVETYAFAYYLFRPPAHNMTSEWDYLYNKAHNEYLNYLATTGAFGLGSYILFIGGFTILALMLVITKSRLPEEKSEYIFYAAALPAAFVSILISNFFGFSVVIINLFLYIIPLWFFFFTNDIEKQKTLELSFKTGEKRQIHNVSPYQWTGVLTVTLVSLFMLIQLIRFWQADVAYALGTNLNHVGDYQSAYPSLTKAVQIRPSEPVFKDELSINLATLGTALIQSNDATTGSQLAQQAISASDEVVSSHPNNVVFWKSRVRVFYLLAQINPQYFKQALEAILVAKKLAPTDAKVSYNVGVLYGQNGQFTKGVEELTQTIALKPNYRDAYYARAIFYNQLSTQAVGTQKIDLANKAIADMQFILKNISPTDGEVIKMLESWGSPPTK